MKLHKYFFLLAACSIILFSCGTQPGKIVYDPDLPADKTALVIFSSSIRVRQYNGIDVREQWYPGGKFRLNKVTLPAGQTTILFDLATAITQGNVTYNITMENVELRHDFEPGKEYTVSVYTEKMGLKTFFLGKFKFGIGVWDYASPTGYPGGREKAVKYWELGEI